MRKSFAREKIRLGRRQTVETVEGTACGDCTLLKQGVNEMERGSWRASNVGLHSTEGGGGHRKKLSLYPMESAKWRIGLAESC